MSPLRGRLPELGSLRVPRGALVILCALIIAGPAALVFASNYRTNSQGLVVHKHTNNYKVYNGVGDGDTQLQSRINQARLAWRAGPQGDNGLLDRNTVRLSSTSSSGDALIDFRRQALGQNNAKVVWSSAYHSGPTTAAFNIYYSNNMSGPEKQGRACNVIGNILGIADNAGGNDCMLDPTQYDVPREQVLDLADSFYGPNIDVTGTLLEASPQLISGNTYTLEAVATGHAMARVDVTLDGDVQPLATSSTTAACDEKCSRSVSLSTTGAQLGAGTHTLHVIAKNAFGVGGGSDPSDVAQADIPIEVVDEPQFMTDSDDEYALRFDPGEAASIGVDDSDEIVFPSATVAIGTSRVTYLERAQDGSVTSTDLGDVDAIDAEANAEDPDPDTEVSVADFAGNAPSLGMRRVGSGGFHCSNAGPLHVTYFHGDLHSYQTAICVGHHDGVQGVRYHGCIEHKRKILFLTHWPDDACKDGDRTQAQAHHLYYKKVSTGHCDDHDYRASNKLTIRIPIFPDFISAMYKSHTSHCG